MSFKGWLLKHATDDTSYGDLARDAKSDKCLRARSYKGMRAHIITAHTPCGSALEALEEASRDFAAQIAAPNS